MPNSSSFWNSPLPSTKKTTPTPRTWLSFSDLTFLFHHLVYLNGFTAQRVKFLGISVFHLHGLRNATCLFEHLKSPVFNSLFCIFRLFGSHHQSSSIIQIVPIIPDSSVHHNYSQLPISSKPTHNHYLTLQISDFRSKNWTSEQFQIFLGSNAASISEQWQ